MQKSRQPDTVSRDETCSNHPWRPAYARCSLCHRPFCYADLVDYNHLSYCLEDIGHVKVDTAVSEPRPNRFNYLSSLLFLGIAAALLYYVYPQQLYIISTYSFRPSSIATSLTQIASTYPVIMAYLLFGVLALMASIAMLSTSIRRFYAAVVILMLILFFLLYEYTNTFSTSLPNYLLYLIMAVFACMLAAVLSRLGYVGQAKEGYSARLEWPAVETF